MLYCIDYEHFMVDMIDFFTREEILSFIYIDISVRTPHDQSNYSAKVMAFVPSSESEFYMAEHSDEKVADDMYYEQLSFGLNTPDRDQNTRHIWYKFILGPLRDHANVMLMCLRPEMHYMKTLCKFIKNEFGIDTINLNKLFTDGHVGNLVIDFKELKDRTRDIKTSWKEHNILQRSMDVNGRRELMKDMTKKEKIKQLKAVGVSYIPKSEEEIDALLTESWVNNQ